MTTFCIITSQAYHAFTRYSGTQTAAFTGAVKTLMDNDKPMQTAGDTVYYRWGRRNCDIDCLPYILLYIGLVKLH